MKTHTHEGHHSHRARGDQPHRQAGGRASRIQGRTARRDHARWLHRLDEQERRRRERDVPGTSLHEYEGREEDLLLHPRGRSEHVAAAARGPRGLPRSQGRGRDRGRNRPPFEGRPRGRPFHRCPHPPAVGGRGVRPRTADLDDTGRRTGGSSTPTTYRLAMTFLTRIVTPRSRAPARGSR